MADITITRGTTLPDTASKADFHNLVDTATGTTSNIVNADIDSAAAIVDTKLATISTSQKVNLSAVVATSQAQGDVIYASSATTLSRLGAGTDGQCLTTQGASANPTWSGMTTAGDIEYHSGSDRARLAKGSAYQILRMNSGATAPEWATDMEIVSGNYTGDGSSPKAVTVGFNVTSKTPKLVIVAKGDASGSNSVTHYRMTGLSLGVALADGTSQTNSIGALSANGFAAGSDINSNGVTYYFIAIG